MESSLKVKRLTSDAILPTRKEGDVGYDLYAQRIEKLDNGLIKISTGIAIELPVSFWGKIESRSSMGAKGFDIHGGVIDNGYRGPIICILSYHGNADPLSLISHGDKIAQLVLHYQEPFGVEEVEELSTTERGDKGFGSTGK